MNRPPSRLLLQGLGSSVIVAWDDGHESTFRPTAGTVHTVHPSEKED